MSDKELRELVARLYETADRLAGECTCFSPARTELCRALEALEAYEERVALGGEA